MSYDRDKSIIAQNAGTTAANLVATIAGGHGFELGEDEVLRLFEKIRVQVFDGTLALAGEKAGSVSVQEVVKEFPGATVEQTAPTNSKGSAIFKSGKYQGKTIAEVASIPEDRQGRNGGLSYLEFYANNGKDDATVRAVRSFLASAA